MEYTLRLDFFTTNNETKNEALLVGLEIMKELGVKHLTVYRTLTGSGQVKDKYKS